MLFHLLRSRRTAIAESGHTRPNRRAPRFCVQITKLVTLSAAPTSPMTEIRTRPGSLLIQPEWAGNCACTKMSAAVPFQGWRSPRSTRVSF